MSPILIHLKHLAQKLGEKVNNLPVRMRLFLVNFGVVLLFLILIFTSDTLLLKPYYHQMKEQTLTSTLEAIAELDLSDTESDGRASQELFTQLKSMEESGNMQIIIVSAAKQVVYYDSDYAQLTTRSERFNSPRQWIDSIFQMEGTEYRGTGTLTDPLISKRRNAKTNIEFLSSYAVVPNHRGGDSAFYYVILNTSVSAIDDAVSVFNDFVLMLCAVAMIVSGFVSVVLSSNFVRPILQINEATKRMAGMDFSVKLNIRSKDELGELAESINDLSSQLESKISELSVANEQLKKDIQEKEKIDIMRRELISNVSHELKTPLAIIMGYCEGLQLNINDEEKDYYCSVIADEAVKMNSLAARLLNVAELEFGTYLDITEFSLAELAEERLKTMSYIFAEHGITTECKTTGKAMIQADYGRIEEVINNLLSNAQHHTPDGGRITVEVIGKKSRAICKIYNSGSHIPDESLDRIWESFYKVDKARTRKYGGSGLGLKIVSSILDMHGGTYKAENTEDGVIFSFTLPKVHPADSNTQQKTEGRPTV